LLVLVFVSIKIQKRNGC